jgi:hypothetical protein
MDELYLTKKNWYWKYLQRILPLVNKKTGEAWVTKKEHDKKMAEMSEED